MMNCRRWRRLRQSYHFGGSAKLCVDAAAADLYGRRLVAHLRHKLRDEKQYADNAALQSAIGEDVCAVRRILGG